jgi:hypothetical protein
MLAASGRRCSCGGPTNGIGDVAHRIVAHVQVAQTPAFYEPRREGGEEVVGEGESGLLAC